MIQLGYFTLDTLDIGKAKAFYGAIAVATGLGIALNFMPIDPIKALFWSAVINGVVAVPIMMVTMLMARNPRVMDCFTLPPLLTAFGWLATAVMAAVVGVMAATSF